MEDAAEIVESTPVEMPSRRRIDWRTGKETVWQPRSFWQEHERRRAASGLSISQYCEQHGLARSTLRRWSAQLQGRGNARMQKQPRVAKAWASSAGFLSVPIVEERVPVDLHEPECARDRRRARHLAALDSVWT